MPQYGHFLIKLVNPAGQAGPYVNVVKHKWQRRERFYLWLETAVPIQLALFQNYPEGLLPSRQVSPDERFASSFATIMPGGPYRFPVLFKTDDDLRDEQVSLVVVRSDAQVLPINGAPVASASVVIPAIMPMKIGRFIVFPSFPSISFLFRGSVLSSSVCRPISRS